MSLLLCDSCSLERRLKEPGPLRLEVMWISLKYSSILLWLDRRSSGSSGQGLARKASLKPMKVRILLLNLTFWVASSFLQMASSSSSPVASRARLRSRSRTNSLSSSLLMQGCLQRVRKATSKASILSSMLRPRNRNLAISRSAKVHQQIRKMNSLPLTRSLASSCRSTRCRSTRCSAWSLKKCECRVSSNSHSMLFMHSLRRSDSSSSATRRQKSLSLRGSLMKSMTTLRIFWRYSMGSSSPMARARNTGVTSSNSWESSSAIMRCAFCHSPRVTSLKMKILSTFTCTRRYRLSPMSTGTSSFRFAFIMCLASFSGLSSASFSAGLLLSTWLRYSIFEGGGRLTVSSTAFSSAQYLSLVLIVLRTRVFCRKNTKSRCTQAKERSFCLLGWAKTSLTMESTTPSKAAGGTLWSSSSRSSRMRQSTTSTWSYSSMILATRRTISCSLTQGKWISPSISSTSRKLAGFSRSHTSSPTAISWYRLTAVRQVRVRLSMSAIPALRTCARDSSTRNISKNRQNSRLWQISSTSRMVASSSSRLPRQLRVRSSPRESLACTWLAMPCTRLCRTSWLRRTNSRSVRFTSFSRNSSTLVWPQNSSKKHCSILAYELYRDCSQNCRTSPKSRRQRLPSTRQSFTTSCSLRDRNNQNSQARLQVQRSIRQYSRQKVTFLHRWGGRTQFYSSRETALAAVAASLCSQTRAMKQQKALLSPSACHWQRSLKRLVRQRCLVSACHLNHSSFMNQRVTSTKLGFMSCSSLGLWSYSSRRGGCQSTEARPGRKGACCRSSCSSRGLCAALAMSLRQFSRRTRRQALRNCSAMQMLWAERASSTWSRRQAWESRWYWRKSYSAPGWTSASRAYLQMSRSDLRKSLISRGEEYSLRAGWISCSTASRWRTGRFLERRKFLRVSRMQAQSSARRMMRTRFSQVQAECAQSTPRMSFLLMPSRPATRSMSPSPVLGSRRLSFSSRLTCRVQRRFSCSAPFSVLFEFELTKSTVVSSTTTCRIFSSQSRQSKLQTSNLLPGAECSLKYWASFSLETRMKPPGSRLRLPLRLRSMRLSTGLNFPKNCLNITTSSRQFAKKVVLLQRVSTASFCISMSACESEHTSSSSSSLSSASATFSIAHRAL